jgi:hypothetical protein
MVVRRRVLPAALVGILLGLLLGLLGATAAAAADYPPPSGTSGRVDPSRIHSGDCAVFSGQGFRAHSDIAVTDNGSARGTTQTTPKGEFAMRLCYPVGSAPGRHELRGSGYAGGDGMAASRTAAGGPTIQTVTAVLYVDAVPAVVAGEGGGAVVLPRTEGGGRLAFTGFPALVAVVSGVVLLLLGAALLVVTEHRARRGTSPA